MAEHIQPVRYYLTAILLCSLAFMGIALMQARAYGQQAPNGGVNVDVILPLQNTAKDPCEDVRKNRSSAFIGDRSYKRVVRTAPNADLPADGTLGCGLQAVEDAPLPPK
jgi:hypothetical protein